MLPDYIEENLNAYSKEQLIFMIGKYWNSMCNISEICVDESKIHISPEKAVNKIREELRLPDLPFSSNSERFLAFIDYKMGKNNMSEYRKDLKIKGDDNMPYVNQEQYNKQRNLRDMIDGELNRIAVTDDLEEIDRMVNFLQHSILRYALMHRNRINGVYKENI